MKLTLKGSTGLALMLFAGLALPACSEQKERTFETRTEDKSGGEFIVTDANREGVEVELPKTEMTPVAPGSPAGQPVREIDVMEQGN